MFYYIEKTLRKIKTLYTKSYVKSAIKCKHNNFSVVGNITLINRNIILGENVTIYPDVMFYGDGIIEIGNNVSIGNGTIIYSSSQAGGVHIGDNTLIAAQCYIIDTDHGTQKSELIRNQTNITEPVYIGSDVWLAAGVKVLRGAKICDHAVIGAQSVVKGEVDEYAIAVGVPAKTIKYRS